MQNTHIFSSIGLKSIKFALKSLSTMKYPSFIPTFEDCVRPHVGYLAVISWIDC